LAEEHYVSALQGSEASTSTKMFKLVNIPSILLRNLFLSAF